MASYRSARFPRGSALAVIIVVTFFIIFQLKFNDHIASPASSKPRPRSTDPRIAIVTFTTSQQSFTHLSLKNKHVYAKRHGYDLVVDYETNEPRGAMWHKFVMLETAMATKKYDWIWWIDFDTLITNTTIKLEDIIQESLANHTRPNDVDFLLTADCFQLNAGSMLVRSRPSALDFLNIVRAYGDAHSGVNEQDCIRDVINQNSNHVADQALWIPQWKLNAFPEEIRCWDEDQKGWEKGLFVVHFAGAWAHVKEEDPAGFLMNKYAKEIIWP